ncbi:MAG: TPM domain-containing protein [Bryobacteraceae bacterium]
MKAATRLLACSLALPFFILTAADFSQLQPQGYLSDFARVVDPASRTRIERYCRSIEDQTGAQIALVTIPTLDGEPIEDVANQIYRKWGVGQKGKNEGILLLLSVRDRRSRLEVGYGLEPYIPDGFAGSILRAMRPALRDNHFGDAMIAAAGQIGERILQAKNIDPNLRPRAPAAARQRDPGALGGNWPFLVFLAIFFLLFVISSRAHGGRYHSGAGALPWWLLLGGAGRHGGRGSSHGGFGGSDGWGGFGGFGGGDSGGGGASGDW